jgi:hypothetical protein
MRKWRTSSAAYLPWNRRLPVSPADAGGRNIYHEQSARVNPLVEEIVEQQSPPAEALRPMHQRRVRAAPNPHARFPQLTADGV